MIIETEKSIIEFAGNTAIKTMKGDFPIGLTTEWLDCYRAVRASCPYLVEVYEVDQYNRRIVMENLGATQKIGTILKNEESQDIFTKKLICDLIIAVTDTWTRSIEFSQTLSDTVSNITEFGAIKIPFESRYFVYCDFSLFNVVLTTDQKIRVIDPDSFSFVNKLMVPHTEKYFLTQMELMYHLTKLRYV